MKRTAAMFLALTLALVSVGAFADTLTIQPGTPINATSDIFQSVFGVIANAAGIPLPGRKRPFPGKAMVYAVYLADSGEMNGDRTDELNKEAQQTMQFMAECLSDAQKFQDGAAMTFTVLDHPAGCEISGAATPQEGTLNIRIVVAGQDSVLGSDQ